MLPYVHLLLPSYSQVFLFVVNEKGSSWGYTTPGFGAPLQQTFLRQLREMAKVPDHGRYTTEVNLWITVDTAHALKLLLLWLSCSVQQIELQDLFGFLSLAGK